MTLLNRFLSLMADLFDWELPPDLFRDEDL
jgi:hypothetical protein